MKKGNRYSFLIGVFLLLGAGSAWAQFPFYDIEQHTVCYDSSGVRLNLQKVDLYVVGRSDIVQSWYFDADGNAVVPGIGATVYDSPCWEAITQDTVNVVSFESAFSGGDYTIPPDTYDVVTITNIGYDTHLIIVGNANSMRLLPGEAYIFRSSFDEFTREVLRNPTVVIKQGVASINNLRVYAETK